MNREQFENQWPQIRAILRDKWNNLTEEDIRQINGRYDQLISKIQQRYGLTRDEAEDQLNIWAFDRGIKGVREPAYAESHHSTLKWLVLAGIPLLLLAGYFLRDITRPTEHTFAKPKAMTQNMPLVQDESTPDNMLLMRLRQVIEANNLSPLTNITIESSNGIVTIRGQVANQQEKDLISRIIERVSGVKQINNQAEVK